MDMHRPQRMNPSHCDVAYFKSVGMLTYKAKIVHIVLKLQQILYVKIVIGTNLMKLRHSLMAFR